MRLIVGGVAALFALAWTMPEEASAQSRGYRTASGKTYYRTYRRRPASVGPNGLCQRDTGTPTGQLNFRNKCDTEEFWNRVQSRGSNRR